MSQSGEATPVHLPDGTLTCRHTVAYSHRPRSCHCRRCYAPLPWRCPSETKTEAPSNLFRWLWIYLNMLWVFWDCVFFYFDLFYLLIVGVKCCYCSWLQSVTPTRTHTHSLENPVRGIGPLRRPLPVKHTNSEDTNSHAPTWSESAFQARTWRHTYALDRGVTGIGIETKCSY